MWSTNLPAVRCFELCQLPRELIGKRLHFSSFSAQEVLAAMTTMDIPRADRADTGRRVQMMGVAAANYLNELKQ